MKSKKGFSLVELLIVIGIIAVLGGVMLTQFSGSTESALATNCLNNMRSLCNAVLAQASKDGYYPAAGPYRYLDIDPSSDTYNQTPWHQGWIGNTSSDEPVSCYHDPAEDGIGQHNAITNGTIWRAMGGARSAYVCPAHTKHCKKGNLPLPSWSYVMNSFFGWESQKAFAGETGGRRGFGDGMFTFRYSSAPSSRTRSAERVLLFAEIPFRANGLQTPDYSTSSDTSNDMTLQYANDDGGDEKSNRSAGAGGAAAEAIGFNHKAGQDYCAHVAFADGHCAKLVMPRGGNEENLKSLTAWLCTGQDYTFNGAVYTKVEE